MGTSYVQLTYLVFILFSNKELALSTEDDLTPTQKYMPTLSFSPTETKETFTPVPTDTTPKNPMFTFVPISRATEKSETSSKLLSSVIENEAINVTVSSTETVETSTPVSKAFEEWYKTDKVIKQLAQNAVRRILPMIIRSGSNVNVSANCLGSGLKLLRGIRNIKEWAIRMLDATGKPPGGILTGTITGFGSYDECMNIVATQSQKELFRGSYCTVSFRPPLPPKPRFYSIKGNLKGFEDVRKDNAFWRTIGVENARFFYFLSFRFGVCVPSTCGRQDIENIANAAAKYVGFVASVPRCEVKEATSFSNGQIAVIAVLSGFVALMTTGTVIELFYLKWKDQPIEKQGLAAQLVCSFSVYSNLQNLFNTSSAVDNLRALHGLKVISINWIVLCHTYLFVNFHVFRNLKRSTVFPTEFGFQAISNGFVSVDTFFFVSGFLVVYTTLKSVKEVNGRFSIPVFLMHRYIRLAPTLLMVSAIVIIIPLLGSGPLWNETLEFEVEGCKNWWWSNAIFLNNFIGNEKQRCLFHAWYLSCEMQMFILSLCVIFPIIKNKGTISVCVNIAFVLISIVTIALITYYRDFPPVQLFANPDIKQQFVFSLELYTKPYTHLGPYAVGLLLGHMYVRKPHLTIPKNVKILGWLLAISCSLAVVYGVYPWNNGVVPSRSTTILYAATHRLVWTLGVAWITLLCITGQGGIVNKILSNKYFIPFSRITLEVYLLHPLVQRIYLASAHERIYASHYIAAYTYIGHMVIVYIISFVCCLAFDTPFYRLQKLLLIRKLKKSDESN
ncbi:nose resistant to fluoxetine protein 6-like [Tachypleus tridentatus]|uniref:nose resistant to fluoxetine protein 6-like n=1 Tax=Tachypleus tridentatus TaxID=6853 RepID=UPI003FD23285